MTYELIDSGDFRKLEMVGNQCMIRPCPQAVWEPRLSKSEWQQARDTYLRSSKGGGKWAQNSLPEKWDINFGGFDLVIN